MISELIKEGAADGTIEKFFQNQEVSYIHLRDGEYGCYVGRIVKST